jgi:hypothetical protein
MICSRDVSSVPPGHVKLEIRSTKFETILKVQNPNERNKGNNVGENIVFALILGKFEF